MWMKFFHFFLIDINYFQIQNSQDFKLPYKKHDYTKAIRYFTFFKTNLPHKNIIDDKHLLYLPPALRLSSFLVLLVCRCSFSSFLSFWLVLVCRCVLFLLLYTHLNLVRTCMWKRRAELNADVTFGLSTVHTSCTGNIILGIISF